MLYLTDCGFRKLYSNKTTKPSNEFQPPSLWFSANNTIVPPYAFVCGILQSLALLLMDVWQTLAMWRPPFLRWFLVVRIRMQVLVVIWKKSITSLLSTKAPHSAPHPPNTHTHMLPARPFYYIIPRLIFHSSVITMAQSYIAPPPPPPHDNEFLRALFWLNGKLPSAECTHNIVSSSGWRV